MCRIGRAVGTSGGEGAGTRGAGEGGAAGGRGGGVTDASTPPASTSSVSLFTATTTTTAAAAYDGCGYVAMLRRDCVVVCLAGMSVVVVLRFFIL